MHLDAMTRAQIRAAKHHALTGIMATCATETPSYSEKMRVFAQCLRE